jgi:hypothetical protein
VAAVLFQVSTLSETDAKEEKKRKSGRKTRERWVGMSLQLNVLTFRLALVVKGVVAGLVSTIEERGFGS